jgi:LPS O-antigen subunit length determinant protein (WzzB/FepE family)
MNQNSSGQFSPQAQSNESEISLFDILVFLRRSYKLIALIGILGVATAFGYLLIVPKQYQASAQIQMAQIGISNNYNNNNYNNYNNNNYYNNKINPLGISIEEPALLIARLSSPTSYTAETAKLCGLESKKDAQAILSKSVKLTIPKGVANVVDMKIIGASPEASTICAQAVFDLIKATQAQIVKPYIEDAKAKLLNDQERLAKSKDLLVKADKSGSAMSAAYLSTRDEIRFLLDEITNLTNVVSSNENRATRLVAPIYVSEDPIAPKKRNVLLMGLFGGLFLGLLIAFWCQLIPKIKAQLQKNALPK